MTKKYDINIEKLVSSINGEGLEVELRELTELEKSELKRMTFLENENGYRVLLSMIAIDLMGENAYNHQIIWDEMLDYIESENYHKGDGFAVMFLIETWVRKLAVLNGIDVEGKGKSKCLQLICSLVENIIEVYIGAPLGAKQREMKKCYENLKEDINIKTGKDLSDLTEENYKFIVSCLEYLGVKRMVVNDHRVVDVTGIYYWTDII